MKKKTRIFVIAIFLIVIFSGCSVASEKEIIKYSKEKYGEATLIRTEELSDTEVKCHFKDKEYGFEYYVTSYMNDIIIDGSNFGAAESKGSNFDIQYYKYINDAIDYELSLLEKKHNIIISVSDGTYIYYFARVSYTSSDTSNVSLITKEVSDLYTSIDTRHY